MTLQFQETPKPINESLNTNELIQTLVNELEDSSAFIKSILEELKETHERVDELEACIKRIGVLVEFSKKPF